MNTKTASNVEHPSRVLVKSFQSILAAALLIGALGATTSRADIVYVGNEFGGNIDKIPSSGTPSVFATTPGGTDAFGMAFDSAGNLYVVTGNEILKFTPNGAESVFANNGLDDPVDIAFDKATRLRSSHRAAAPQRSPVVA